MISTPKFYKKSRWVRPPQDQWRIQMADSMSLLTIMGLYWRREPCQTHHSNVSLIKRGVQGNRSHQTCFNRTSDSILNWYERECNCLTKQSHMLNSWELFKGHLKDVIKNLSSLFFNDIQWRSTPVTLRLDPLLRLFISTTSYWAQMSRDSFCRES